MSKEMRVQINKVKNWKQFLNENQNLMNQILDKISSNGIVSLNTGELKYLKQYSTNNINPDLEKSLQVDIGYVFVSKNRTIPLLKFEYNETEEYEDGQMLHKGTVYFEDLEFGGEIYCDDELDGKIEKFFKNEVCPYLTYSF